MPAAPPLQEGTPTRVELVHGAEWLDVLPNVEEGNKWCPWIFLGFGPRALGLDVYRTMTDLPSPSTWDWVWTGIFLAIALGTFVDFSGEIARAVALVVIVALIMFNALWKQ